MKRIPYLLPVVCLLCLSCNKNDDEPAEVKNVFEADIDGKHWQADSAGAVFVYYAPQYGGSFFRLAGSSSNGQSFHLTTKSEAPSETTFAVQLSAFAVRSDLPNSNGIIVSWTTANELNTDHFDIERSADAVSFSKVGEVKAAGNSSAQLSYQWHYKPPLISTDGRHYYRLKTVDTDGKFQFSTVVVIAQNLSQYYMSSASDTAYHLGFNGSIMLTSNDTAAKRITGTFQFDYVDDGTGKTHTVRNGTFTNLAY